MLRPGDSVALTVEKPAAGGRMIARAGGQVVLVAGAIPGERVQARIERVTKGVAHADTIAIDERSPDRREPFVEPVCGGSLYSYIAYPRQLTLKSEVIADAFRRIARLELPASVAVAASPEEGYRMRARLHVRGQGLGFFREGTHDICDARATRQLLPSTCDVLDRLAAAMRSLGGGEIREVELTENADASERVVHFDAAQPLDRRVIERLAAIEGLTPGPYVVDAIRVGGCSLTLRRHVLAFFQGNRYLLGDLVAHVVERVPIGAGLVDLYAGVGLFAVAAAATRAASVTAVEGDPHAAADLHANAARVGRITTMKGAVEGLFTGASRMLRQKTSGPLAETVIVDPPRTGMSREALDTVLALGAPRLIYVSCDVATLARDARRLVDGGYALERVDAFDLFPNTPHVESVVVLENLRI
jgi:23S rRNA (uracil1939-C5)-methyltransferase